ncbi:MAG TPA: hypothetical protein VGM31_20325 [Puia sp.]
MLKNIDPDDVSDVLKKVEKTLEFSFGDNDLESVRTFGELLDIITSKVQGEDADDCTTQLVFYKLRNAIGATLATDKRLIKPGTSLEALFPVMIEGKR